MAVRHRGRQVRRLALALTGIALALAASAAAASAAVTLDWTQTAVYNLAAPSGTERTWLGFVTSPAPLANGTASASGGATGPTVNTASPHGLDALYTYSYPAVSGSIDPIALTGTMEFDGSVSFVSPQAGGNDFTFTVENPQLQLNGDDGAIYASGAGVGATATYDRTQPLFTFDLTNAHWSLAADGTSSLVGIVPAVGVTNYAFFAQYAAGAGPERTPPTFGTFALEVTPDGGPEGPQGAEGPIGPVGPTGLTGLTGLVGPKGAQGPRGKRGARGRRGPAGKAKRSQVARLAKAPFGKGARSVTLTRKGKVVASGSVRGRTLRVTLRGPKLRGVYVLRPTAQATKTFSPLRVRVG